MPGSVPRRRRGSTTYETAECLLAEYGPVPVRVQDACRAGISANRIRAAVSAGTLTALHPGVVVATRLLRDGDDRDQHLLRVRAARLVVPDGISCFRSGRAVHGLPEPFPNPRLAEAPVDLLVRGSTGWRGAGFRVHGCPLDEALACERDGIPVTSLARTAVDSARGLPLPRALVPVDAALRRLAVELRPGEDPRWTVRDTEVVERARAVLTDVVSGMYGWPGVVAARRAVAVAHPGAESPRESMSRGVALDGGLDPPDCGIPVLGEDGLTSWADLAWWRFRVLGEADGRLKYVSPDALYAEKRREDALRRAGWVVVRWTYDELVRTPWVVVERIARPLRAAGWQPR